MKTFGWTLAAALAALTLALAAPVHSADPKLLRNVRGEVQYQKPSAGPKALAAAASIALDDMDTAITGDSSVGEVLLPDSTRVMVGSNSKVQLEFFNQAATTSASFIVFNGKTRFKVEHPGGAPANYIFKTPTAQIAVRGTEGDIGVSDAELDVNVYHLGDPNAPVEVSFTGGTSGGKTIKLVGGQSMVAQIINGVVQAKVDQLKQDAIDKFSADFGLPASIDHVKQQVIEKVKSVVPGLPKLPF